MSTTRYRLLSLAIVVSVVIMGGIWRGFRAGYIGPLQCLLYANYGAIREYVANAQEGRVVELPLSLRGMTVSVSKDSVVIGNPDNPDRLLMFDPKHVALKQALMNSKRSPRVTELIGDWWFVSLAETDLALN